MRTLQREVNANFSAFASDWPAALEAARVSLEKQDSRFRESYGRIVSLQAWRTELLDTACSTDSLGFFLEAQNDAIVSHVLAGLGTWRAALQSLRSCIENVLFCVYYKDHPVEYQLWSNGKHKLGFRRLQRYISVHPQFTDIPMTKTVLASLGTEYATLSRAVHASAAGFRMTDTNVGIQLWIDDAARLGMWITRHRHTLNAINSILLIAYRDQLVGTKHTKLRKAVSLAIPKASYA